MQEAWRAYHAGDFARAVTLGLGAGEEGLNVANKALVIHASYLLDDKYAKREAFELAASNAEKLQKRQPGNVNAWYFHALALGRYSQVISVSKALSIGIGDKIKSSLEQALTLEPDHAEAHIAFGAWHAEIIDKLGAMIGGITYGARRMSPSVTSRRRWPSSPLRHRPHGVRQRHGDDARQEQDGVPPGALRRGRRACEPLDAMERLDVEAAREELADE